MKGERGGFYGSGDHYVVIDVESGEPVPDMLILDPMSGKDAIGVVEKCGLVEWANELRRKLGEYNERE